jgi:hypothetical protein
MMLRVLLLTGYVLAATPQAAFADTAPFFAGKKLYASDWRACVGFENAEAPDDTYTLDQTGIYGYEFSCVFANMFLVPDLTGQGRQNNYVATASCSDDSGISRPDMLNLSHYEETVTVTSQNDYNYDLLQPSQDGEGVPFGLVNKSFELCQPE